MVFPITVDNCFRLTRIPDILRRYALRKALLSEKTRLSFIGYLAYLLWIRTTVVNVAVDSEVTQLVAKFVIFRCEWSFWWTVLLNWTWQPFEVSSGIRPRNMSDGRIFSTRAWGKLICFSSHHMTKQIVYQLTNYQILNHNFGDFLENTHVVLISSLQREVHLTAWVE